MPMKSTRTPRYRRFLAQLRAARIEAGLTQAQAAKRLKQTQPFVSRSESGDRRIDVLELRDFARLYKKPFEYFVD